MTYPSQLQAMLDPTQYAVTNLGACGSTMQKGADVSCRNRVYCTSTCLYTLTHLP